MEGIRRSFLISLADKYSKQLIALISTMILARILTPEQVGVFSIALGITTISAMLRDFGVSAYLIQERDLTESRLQSALGMVSVTAVVMGLGLVLLAAPFSNFFHKPDMRYAIYVLSLIFIFVPFNAIVMTLLRREMNFAAIYRMSFSGAVAGGVVSVATALMGAGFMCGAYGSVANSIATSAMAYRQRPKQYRMVPRFTEWRRVTSFGALASLTNIVIEMGRRIPEFVIGRSLGLIAVGMFSRANSLVTLMTESLVTPVMAVAISVFSIKNRQSGEVKELYLSALSLLTSVTWPAFIFAALMSFPVIRILSGPQWDAAVPLARFTCMGGAFSALIGLQYSVFQAVGAVRYNLVATVITTILRVAAIFWASHYGLMASVMALALSGFLSFGIIEHYVNRVIGASFQDTLAATWRSVLITAATGIIPAVVVVWGGNDPRTMWLQLGIGAVGGGAMWLGAILALGHPLKDEIHLVFARLLGMSKALGAWRN